MRAENGNTLREGGKWELKLISAHFEFTWPAHQPCSYQHLVIACHITAYAVNGRQLAYCYLWLTQRLLCIILLYLFIWLRQLGLYNAR